MVVPRADRVGGLLKDFRREDAGACGVVVDFGHGVFLGGQKSGSSVNTKFPNLYDLRPDESAGVFRIRGARLFETFVA